MKTTTPPSPATLLRWASLLALVTLFAPGCSRSYGTIMNTQIDTFEPFAQAEKDLVFYQSAALNTLVQVDMRTGESKPVWPVGQVGRISTSTDKSTWAFRVYDADFYIWKPASEELRRVDDLADTFDFANISPDGTRLAYKTYNKDGAGQFTSDRRIQVINLSTMDKQVFEPEREYHQWNFHWGKDSRSIILTQDN
ncbi:hypothetical protein [Bradymonas sediminis]|nr:hypothetical protein [Bradymonas sediminis]TDP75988.1 hypothetical protein DFR33_103337 [Bradymonas sediminis]